MGLRDWMQRRMLSYDGRAELPAHASLMHRWFSEEAPRTPVMGEPGTTDLPKELEDMLRRRAEVASGLLELDLTSAAGRVAAIPQLQALLRVYPHPMAYEGLILAYADAGRWDEARGAAYAAAARRRECEHSRYPEIRLETDRLRAWTSADVEELRLESQTRPAPR